MFSPVEFPPFAHFLVRSPLLHTLNWTSPPVLSPSLPSSLSAFTLRDISGWQSPPSLQPSLHCTLRLRRRARLSHIITRRRKKMPQTRADLVRRLPKKTNKHQCLKARPPDVSWSCADLRATHHLSTLPPPRSAHLSDSSASFLNDGHCQASLGSHTAVLCVTSGRREVGRGIAEGGMRRRWSL